MLWDVNAPSTVAQGQEFDIALLGVEVPKVEGSDIKNLKWRWTLPEGVSVVLSPTLITDGMMGTTNKGTMGDMKVYLHDGKHIVLEVKGTIKNGGPCNSHLL